MAASVVNIKIHHGGTFSKDGVLTYIGGQVSHFRNCDVDRFSYFELVGMIKDIGCCDGDEIFYTIPGYSLEAGIDQIHDDSSVSRMLKLAKPNVLLDLYIQHVDQDGVSANASFGEAMEDVNMDKNCLGALDGTFIKVNVRVVEKPRYRCKKNYIATNVLGVCAPDMQFIYVLGGWEGSAADERVLRDALSRANGMRVPRGCYYLVDVGYKNCEGFLAPYRGQRYHLQEWTNPPTKKEELFKTRHASARNVIERTFGLLKMRWGILRNPSYYSVETHTNIILACFYLHNLIRQQMSNDPLEEKLDEYMRSQQPDIHAIDSTETST